MRAAAAAAGGGARAATTRGAAAVALSRPCASGTGNVAAAMSLSTLAAATTSTSTRSTSTSVGALATRMPHAPLRAFSTSMAGFSSRASTLRHRHYGLCVVPQQSAYVIERLGKFSRVLSPGMHVLLPLFDRIAYVHNLKEQTIPISNQQAITMDNVTITIDGVLYLRVVDPVKASYGVADIYYAMTQLAQTTMRSELGKISLDKTFVERDSLNHNIVQAMNQAAEPWGVTCLRYEIRDITPPANVKFAMELQAEAERRKRATVLESEGNKQQQINLAEGSRQSAVLSAQGEAAALLARAEAASQSIRMIADAISIPGGKDAVALQVAEQYVNAFAQLAKQGNTVLLPANLNDPSAMIGQALGLYGAIAKQQQQNASTLPFVAQAAAAATAAADPTAANSSNVSSA